MGGRAKEWDGRVGKGREEDKMGEERKGKEGREGKGT